MEQLNRIYNEDAIAFLKTLPDKCIDCVLTDPPYKYLDHRLESDYDEISYIKGLMRVTKKDALIAHFGR